MLEGHKVKKVIQKFTQNDNKGLSKKKALSFFAKLPLKNRSFMIRKSIVEENFG